MSWSRVLLHCPNASGQGGSVGRQESRNFKKRFSQRGLARRTRALLELSGAVADGTDVGEARAARLDEWGVVRRAN